MRVDVGVGGEDLLGRGIFGQRGKERHWVPPCSDALPQYDAIDQRTAVTIMGAWCEVVPEPHSISDFLALFRALHRLADSRV